MHRLKIHQKLKIACIAHIFKLGKKISDTFFKKYKWIKIKIYNGFVIKIVTYQVTLKIVF